MLSTKEAAELLGYHSSRETEHLVSKVTLTPADCSKFHQSKMPTLAENLLYAITLACRMFKENKKGGVGTKTTMAITETHMDDSSVVIVVKAKGKILGTLVDKENMIGAKIAWKTRHHFAEAIILSLFPELCNDPEFKGGIGELFDLFVIDGSKTYVEEINRERAYRLSCMLSEHVYYRLISTGTGSLDLEYPAPTLPLINPERFNTDAYIPDDVNYGSFPFLMGKNSDSVEPAVAVYDHDSFAGAYALRDITQEEQKMVPELDPWFVITPTIVDLCKDIKNSSGKRNQVQNVLLRGEAGTGKTQTAYAIAAGVNLPYMLFACHPSTEVFDIVGQFIPISKDEELTGDEIEYDDVLYDPASVYKSITGTDKEDVTPAEVLRMIAGRINQGGTKYRYVESPLVQALRYGWVCEIQEPTLIKEPGVLPGLNAMMEKDGTVVLPVTGETFKRHPNAIVICTTNNDYEGCQPLNKSFVNRMNIIQDVEEFDKELLLQLLKNNTEESDEDMLRAMITVVESMKTELRNMGDNTGVLGLRNLINWVTLTQSRGNPYAAAMLSIIPASSTDPFVRDSLKTTYLDTSVFAR